MREAFDRAGDLTVGIEEELILLDPETLEPAPAAAEVLERLGDPQRFKPELPAAQLEIVTPPCAGVGEALGHLAEGRRAVLGAAGGRLAAAIPVHPFAAPVAELSPGRRYERLQQVYGRVARLQLVASVHVHVAVGTAERSVAVYNALRSYLPEISALAASGPFHGGTDTGLASIRPKIADRLPRQGVPPAFESLEAYAAALESNIATGAMPEPSWWWYELRLHPGLGTVEVRAADAQATVSQAGGIAAVVQSLVARLADRHDAGELPVAAPTHRIEENRCSAIRDGVSGRMRDLESGTSEPTSERLERLIENLAPYARSLGCEAELAAARELARRNGAIRQREIAAQCDGDLLELTRRLAACFTEGIGEAGFTGDRSG